VPSRSLAALFAVVTLASCGTGDDAASVNDVAIRTSDLEQTISDFAAIGETQLNNGVADGETVRGLLTSLIRAEVTKQVLAAANEEITEGDREEIAQQFAEQGATGIPDTLRDLIIELNAANAVLGRVQAPSADDVADRYQKNPKSLGMLCVRHLVVKTEALARQARVELGNAPTDEAFAKVAGQYSDEPNADETGGALVGQTSDCIGINEWQAGFDRDFVAGALGARTGVPTQPVKTSFGWHVIFIRPFTAVAESVSNNFAQSAGEFLLLGALADSDISVASRYGRWDPLAGSVVAP
jgi:parvulin-like peptidyl-prolyl isomerase